MSEMRNFKQKALRRIAISYGRSGTHWLKGLISDAMGFKHNERYQARLLTAEALKAALEHDATRTFICEEFRFNIHATLLDPTVDPSLRLIVLHRHPLDRFISAVWYQCHVNGRMTKPDPDLDTNEFARGLLLGEYDHVRGECYADVFRAFQHVSVLDWIEGRAALEVRYEDLIAQTETQLIRCLEHLEIALDPGDIPRIIEANCFERYSKGRKRGDFDGAHHFRQGVPGEWRKVFHPEDVPILREQFGDLFARQGYPL